MKSPKMTPSWQLLRPNLEILGKLPEQVVVLALLPSLVGVLGSIMSLHGNPAGYGIRAVGALWLLVNVAANYYMQLAAAKGETPSLADCYRASWRYYWRLLGFIIVFSVMFLVGLILLIVPGLIVLRRYFLAFFYIIDLDLPVRDAMSQSAAETRPFAASIWGIIGVMAAVTFSVVIIALVFESVPAIGDVIATLSGLLYLFLPALRYREIRQASKKR